MPRPENPERARKAKEGLYRCSNCRKFLTKECFYRQSSTKYGIYSYCKVCSKILHTKDSQITERQSKANEGLYYCEICKAYLPRRFFTPVKKGRFGLRNKCKPCTNDLANNQNRRIKIEIPKHLRRNIKTLKLCRGESIEDILLDLITEQLAIRQKPQK